MKLNVFLLTVLIPCLSAVVFGQAKVEGRILDDHERPVARLRVVVPGGQATITDSRGHFLINFPPAIQPGKATRIEVVKPNWVVYEPMFGNCVTQNKDINYEPLRVVIVPKGSPLSLSTKRLTDVIERSSSERAALRVEVGNLKKDINEYAFLRRYATEYGFTLNQFRDAVEQWAKIKESDDKEVRAAKEYWQKNYASAAPLASESYETAHEELKQATKKTFEASLKVIRRLQLAGNAFYAQDKFTEALNAYKALGALFETKELSKERFMAQWAATRFLIGNASVELAQRVEVDQGRRLLLDALDEYKLSASFNTPEQLPEEWATLQNNMAAALVRLAERVNGEESLNYIKQAIAAFGVVLKIKTRKQSPEDWAISQNNLGTAFLKKAEVGVEAERVSDLNKAIAAFRGALEEIKRDVLPRQWATVQRNLGVGLARLAERESPGEGVKHLDEAIGALHAALEIKTSTESPQDWLDSMSNLAAALLSLDGLISGSDGGKYLHDAIKTCRDALDVSTKDKSPIQWAALKTNLGIGLTRLGQREGGVNRNKHLDEAMKAFNDALKVRTRDQRPLEWAQVQTNLGLAYLLLNDEARAAETFTNVLTVDQNNKPVFGEASRLYHEKLYDFDKAFLLNQNWLTQHPEDILVRADFAEAHFTIGRFAECRNLINYLLTRPDVPDRSKAALRAIEIASLLAEGKASQVAFKIDELVAEVARQRADFKVEWGFAGTQHFIDQNGQLRPYQVWLGQLFVALASEDRDSLLKALHNVKANFQEQR